MATFSMVNLGPIMDGMTWLAAADRAGWPGRGNSAGWAGRPGWLGQISVGACIAAGALTVLPSPHAEAAGLAARCAELSGAASQTLDKDRLCKNVTTELGKSMSSGKPADLGKALRNSVRQPRNTVRKSLRGHVVGNAPRRLNRRAIGALHPDRRSAFIPPAAGGEAAAKTGMPRRKPRPSEQRPNPAPSASQAGQAPVTARRPGVPDVLSQNRSSDTADSPLADWGVVGQTATVVFGAGLAVWLIGHRVAFVAVGGTRLRRRPRVPGKHAPRRTASKEKIPALPRAMGEAEDASAVPVLIGHRDGTAVLVNLAAAGGLRLIGPGAREVERALLVELMSGAGVRELQTLSGREELRLLLGDDFEEWFTQGLDAMRAEPSSRDVLVSLGTELVRRRAYADDPQAARAAGDQEPRGLVCVIDPQGHAGPLRADLRLGASLGVGALILGDWPYGTTLEVNDCGTVTDATGQAAAGLVGVRMPQMNLDQARRRVAALCGTAFEPPPLKAQSATRPGSGHVGRRQAPPGQISLLGGYTVQGPAGHTAVHSADLRALLALLAEYRSVPVPRPVAEDRLWNGTHQGNRWNIVIRELRVKLCEAVGLPSSAGTAVVHNTGHGYRLNPDLYQIDVWRLRDLLAQATTAPADNTASGRAALLHAAVDLRTGPYLDELTHGWAHTAAQALTREIVAALAQLADLETAPEHAIGHLERATELSPAAEHLYRHRMEIYAALGNTTAVHHCYDRLREELAARGRKPEPASLRLYRQLTGQQ